MPAVGHVALLFATLLAVACGGPGKKPSPPEKGTDNKTASAPGTTIRSGIYRVTGKPVLNHCDDTLVFAADRVQLDIEGGSLKALFDDSPPRAYQLEQRGTELVAQGQFERLPSCGTHRYVEVWRLHASTGGVEGQLTAYYRDISSHRDCLQACKVVMAVKGEWAEPER